MSAPCHSAGRDAATIRTIRRPWADDPRADAKDALLDYALKRPTGVAVSVAAREALDSAPGVTDADHRLALRFYTEEYAHLFKTTRRDGFLWVEPEPWAVILKSSRQTAAEGAVESANLRVNPQRASGSLPSGAPGGRAASVARSVLRDRCQIAPGARGSGVRGALRHALAAHREGVDSDGMRPDKVSSVSRVAARQATFLGAFEAAACRYRRGALLTLTARPGESGDMVDTAVAVNESAGDPLRDHLRRQTPGSGRAPAVVAREVTGRGVLHLHVVVFGVGPAEIDRAALARFWHKTRGHGYVVDVAPVERRPSRSPAGPRYRWVFGDHPNAPTERGRYVRSYLGETLFAFRRVAAASPSELHAGEVAAAWKVAVMWACGVPVVTVSDALRSAGVAGDRTRTRTHTRRAGWRFGGVAHHGRAVARDGATVWPRDRPPPSRGQIGSP